MVRDRTPQTINYALKWCKAKERWVNHVYEHFINIYVDKKERKKAVHAVLGLHKGKVNMDFHKSIAWDHFGITKDEIEYWQWVEGWVNWFRTIFVYIEDEHKKLLDSGTYTQERFRQILCTKYIKNADESIRLKLANFIINCLLQ